MFPWLHGRARVGWLPAGQGAALGISVLGFAVLARILGPDPFAIFATVALIYSVASLMMDVSPQGFLLVNGGRSRAIRVAEQLTWISAACATTVLAGLLLSLPSVLLGKSLDIHIVLGLLIACAAQFFGQVPRAQLLRARAYSLIAIIDVTTMAASVAGAIAFALWWPGISALVGQLFILTVFRAGAFRLATLAARYRAVSIETTGGLRLIDGFRYGLPLITLNISSYLSRSLDSGLLPALIPAAAAAAYARSYQVVVAPMTQLQLSLGGAAVERLARVAESAELNRVRRLLFIAVVVSACAAGVVVSAGSGIISDVLFGPKWPMANVFLAATACQLPVLSLATYSAWQLQIRPNHRTSLIQLLVMLSAPVIVLLLATGGAQSAATAIAVVPILPLILLILVNRARMPRPAWWVLIALLTWALLCGMFFVTAGASEFWEYSFTESVSV